MTFFTTDWDKNITSFQTNNRTAYGIKEIMNMFDIYYFPQCGVFYYESAYRTLTRVTYPHATTTCLYTSNLDHLQKAITLVKLGNTNNIFYDTEEMMPNLRLISIYEYVYKFSNDPDYIIDLIIKEFKRAYVQTLNISPSNIDIPQTDYVKVVDLS